MKSFPPPLTPKEESELLRRSADGDNEARHILIERNLRLVGGIRIFEYIQKHIFPGIKPLQMDVETYEKYEEYAKTISKETMEKLEKVNVPLLEELKEKLLETGKGIEQESFLIEE